MHRLRARANTDNPHSNHSSIVGKELRSTGHGHFSRATFLRIGTLDKVDIGSWLSVVSREGNGVHKGQDFSPRHSHTLT